MRNFFEGSTLTDKTAKKLSKVVIKSKYIQSESDVRAILTATLLPTVGTFLLCTDTDIIHAKTGLVVRFAKYPYTSISAVIQENPSLSLHYVAITIGGGEKKVFEIPTKKEEALKMADFIRKKLVSSVAVPTATLSPSTELKNFKELLDMGAITEDEYNQKKKQLLGL